MKRIFAIILLATITTTIFASLLLIQTNDIVAEITNAIKTGNATNVSKYFNSSIDLTVPASDGTYSKSQAELILKDFFLKNPVKLFTIKHQGNSDDGSLYAIGNYETVSVSFRVYFLLKKNNSGFLIHKLEFEKE